ncbi:MAG TPA: DedA family protein [Phycisphaerales bacterium]|jgi:membrane protein YqaA with SNARE-associated domain|nr:DedA family protein [Phycisphaerales bacterium]
MMQEMEHEHIPNWAIHRRLYVWVLSFAAKSIAPFVLFGIAFVEAFMPFVPPDALLIPMCLEQRRKSGLFAMIAVVGSVAGAMVGYFVIASLIANGTEWVFGAEAIEHIVSEFDKRGISYVFIAALTPVPFFALTTAAGVAKLNFAMFLAACVIGRSLRYGIEAGIVWWIGERAKTFIEKWFNLITIVAGIVVIAGWAILQLL